MTDRVTRLYVLVVAVLVFVLLWAVVAANPWARAKPDPRLAALEQRARHLRVDAKLVGQIVALRARQNAAATTLGSPRPAAPTVRVVNLPPLTVTKTS